MTPEEFRQSLAEQGLYLTDEQMQQFELYYEFLVETNKNLNLAEKIILFLLSPQVAFIQK